MACPQAVSIYKTQLQQLKTANDDEEAQRSRNA